MLTHGAICSLTEGRLLLDVRTIFPEDMEYIADTAAEVLA